MTNVLGTQTVTFEFPESKQSTDTQYATLNPPPGTTATQVFLQTFDVAYTDYREYGFGALQVDLSVFTPQQSQCKVTLRDNTVDQRMWSGTVGAVAMFLQNS